MANHFRSSEGQEEEVVDQAVQNTAPVEPQAVPVEPQPNVASAQQAAPQVSADATQVQVPNVEIPSVQTAQPVAAPGIVTVPGIEVPAAANGGIELPPLQNAAPAVTPVTASEAPADAPRQASIYDEVTAQDYDPAEDAGFTTAFAPVTKNADTAGVNAGGVPVISFQGVSMIYPAQPNKPALDNIDVDVYAGEFVFLVGHSGSGKSTFLKLITRELKPTSGQVMVAGQDLTAMRNWKVPYLRRQIGCVFQDFKLLPDKTIFDNVAFALECIGKPRSVIKAQVPEVLRLVGLGEKMDVYPDQLSGGEQQRVSVARAMVNRPPLLVCDEPTGNLDPAISLGIMKLLERINRTGTTILMATHDREMVDSMRKRVIALEAGHVVRDQEKGGYGYYGTL